LNSVILCILNSAKCYIHSANMINLDNLFQNTKKNQVTNFWPALSDAISTSTSTILVWNILIWLIVPIRFMSAEYLDRTYKRIYNSRSDLSHLAHNRCFQRVIKITYCVHMFEIICLFVLSVIPVNLHNSKKPI
jgi:uncharacterized membrane protein